MQPTAEDTTSVNRGLELGDAFCHSYANPFPNQFLNRPPITP